MEEITIDMILQGLNTAALVVFIVLFVRGDILPKSVTDRILKEAENRTAMLVDAIRKDFKATTKEAMKEAFADIKGFLVEQNGKK